MKKNPLINRRDTGSEQKNVGLTVKLEMRNWGRIKFGTEWRKCGKRPSHQLTRMGSSVTVKTR